MSSPPRYALDANVFIEAHKRYYAFDICPGYWAALLASHEARRLHSIDRVRNELIGQGDALSDWTQQKVPQSFFAGTGDPSITAEFGGIMTWVQAQAQYYPAAKAQFATAADGWLIAYAKARASWWQPMKYRTRQSRERYQFQIYAMHLESITLELSTCFEPSVPAFGDGTRFAGESRARRSLSEFSPVTSASHSGHAENWRNVSGCNWMLLRRVPPISALPKSLKRPYAFF